MEPTNKSRIQLYVILGLIVLVLVVYGWKALAVRSVENRMEDQRAELVDLSRRGLTEQAGEMLKLAGIPLGWAVRAAMLNQDYEQIHHYLERYVKEPHLQRIVLVGAEGTIRAATDKKLEGQPAAEVPDATPPSSDEVSVGAGREGEILLYVPVMGYDSRLGTLVLSYSKAAIDARLPAPPAGGGAEAPAPAER